MIMSWLKRHPLLGAVLACGVLALAAEAWFLRQARQQAARAVALRTPMCRAARLCSGVCPEVSIVMSALE